MMVDMVTCLDAFTGQRTRLVVVVDGLDSCEQSKVRQAFSRIHFCGVCEYQTQFNKILKTQQQDLILES